jgi:hypothetical protein
VDKKTLITARIKYLKIKRLDAILREEMSKYQSTKEHGQSENITPNEAAVEVEGVKRRA